jgi:hypothetical protein
MNQTPQYSFEYPSEWQEDEITKTEKSTMVGSSCLGYHWQRQGAGAQSCMAVRCALHPYVYSVCIEYRSL